MGVWEHSGKFPTGGAERGSLKELSNDGESPGSSLTHREASEDQGQGQALAQGSGRDSPGILSGPWSSFLPALVYFSLNHNFQKSENSPGCSSSREHVFVYRLGDLSAPTYTSAGE